jgi:hypothetical protein
LESGGFSRRYYRHGHCDFGVGDSDDFGGSDSDG